MSRLHVESRYILHRLKPFKVSLQNRKYINLLDTRKSCIE